MDLREFKGIIRLEWSYFFIILFCIQNFIVSVVVALARQSCVFYVILILVLTFRSFWLCWIQRMLKILRISVKIHPYVWVIISFLTMEYWNQTLQYFLRERAIFHNISFLTMEYWNQTLQYFLGARGILHSTLPREYTD